MDLLPTLARFAGASVPRPVDGKDITDLMLAKPGAKSPHESFFYYVGKMIGKNVRPVGRVEAGH